IWQSHRYTLFPYTTLFRSKSLAEQIRVDYHDKRPLLVGMLKGCVPFFAELVKHIDCDLEMDFMDVSSYHGTTESTGKLQINKDLDRKSTRLNSSHVKISYA